MWRGLSNKYPGFWMRGEIQRGINTLDANLNGQPVSPVADALVARGTPFVFATGYSDLAEPYRDRPTLKKPFQMDGLKQMLQSALDRGSQ